jgi:hypothetical protein
VSLRDQLQSVYETHGKLTPSVVVAVATSKNHPLHSRFEWDDKVAGPKYREVQARELIRSVRIVYKPAEEGAPERSVRAFHALRDEDEGERTYMPVDEVVRSEFLTKLLASDMRREWEALRRRWEHFEEFWQMVAEDVA